MVAASATPPSPCSKCSVNPSNNTSKPLKASGKSWEGLHNSLLMASPSTASQLTATSRTPLTDIRFSTGTPKSLNEGNYCEIPQCPECLQAYWEPHQLPCASLLPLFWPRLGTPATSYSTKGPHHHEQKPGSPKRRETRVISLGGTRQHLV